jgi:hypothetical protein
MSRVTECGSRTSVPHSALRRIICYIAIICFMPYWLRYGLSMDIRLARLCVDASWSLVLDAQITADAASAETGPNSLKGQQAAAIEALCAAEEREREVTELRDRLKSVAAHISTHACKRKQLGDSVVAAIRGCLPEHPVIHGQAAKLPRSRHHLYAVSPLYHLRSGDPTCNCQISFSDSRPSVR